MHFHGVKANMEHQTKRIDIGGMRGEDCKHKVSTALGELAGVRVIDVGIGSATILCEPDTESRVREALSSVGYSVNNIAPTVP